MKTEKKKSSQKITFFKADSHGPSGISEALKSSSRESPEQSRKVSDSSQPGRQRQGSISSTNMQPEVNRIKEENDEDLNNNCTSDHKVIVEDKEKSGGGVVNGHCETEMSLRIELNSGTEDNTKPLPPSSGFDLEYLGPAKQDRKSRSHPIFLMPDDKQSLQKQAGKPTQGLRPQSAKDRGASDKDSIATKPPRIPKAEEKETVHSATANVDPDKSLANRTVLRSGVHICEERNITVDITPRNIGRKVTGKSSRKHRFQTDFSDLEVHNALSTSGRVSSSGDAAKPEVAATTAKTRTLSPTGVCPSTPAAPISVLYDGDSESETSSDKKKKHRRRGPVKEKDLVTMVSNISLSDEEDEDDPGHEVDIELGEKRKDYGQTDLGRTSPTVSKGKVGFWFCLFIRDVSFL